MLAQERISPLQGVSNIMFRSKLKSARYSSEERTDAFRKKFPQTSERIRVATVGGEVTRYLDLRLSRTFRLFSRAQTFVVS